MTILTKNIISNVSGQVIVLFLNFLAVKYIFGYLGSEALGVIYFALIINTLLVAVLDLGISSTTVREIANSIKDNPEYAHRVIQTASLFYWGAYLTFSLLIFVSAPFFVRYWIHLQTTDVPTAITIIRILGISSFLALPKSLYESIIRGIQRMEFINLLDVCVTALQQGGIIVFIFIGSSFLTIASWIGLSLVLSIISYQFVVTRFFPITALIPRYHGSIVRHTNKFAKTLMGISILSVVYTESDKLIISAFMPISMVGYYNVGYSGLAKGSLFADAISQAAFPVFSTHQGRGRHHFLLDRFWKLQDVVCLVSVPIFAATPFVVVPFFTFIFNAPTADVLLLPFTLLAIGFYLHNTLMVPYVASLASGNPEITLKANTLALFIILPLSVVLIYFWKLSGAGITWIAYQLFICAYAIPLICRDCLGITPILWYTHVIKIVSLALGIYSISWGIAYITSTDSTLFFVSAYILASLLFGIISYKFLMTSTLKTSLHNYLNALYKHALRFYNHSYPQ